MMDFFSIVNSASAVLTAVKIAFPHLFESFCQTPSEQISKAVNEQMGLNHLRRHEHEHEV